MLWFTRRGITRVRFLSLALIGISGAVLLTNVSVVEAEPSGPSATTRASLSQPPPRQLLGNRPRVRPRGCYGQTDNPHRSRHRPGYITVQGRTVCPGAAVTVQVALYRFASGRWNLVGRGSGRGVGRAVANASSRGRCGRFLGRSVHTASGHYPTVTQNENRIPC